MLIEEIELKSEIYVIKTVLQKTNSSFKMFKENCRIFFQCKLEYNGKTSGVRVYATNYDIYFKNPSIMKEFIKIDTISTNELIKRLKNFELEKYVLKEES